MHITVCRCFWDSRQQGVNSVRTVKGTLKEFKEMSEISNTSLKARIWSFLKIATCFFASLATAPLFHTHRSRRVVAAFWLSVLASVFAPDFQLFLTHSHHHFLPFWHSNNETASTTETITLCERTQFFVNRTFNCIPKRDRCLLTSHTLIAFLEWDGSWCHTPPTENILCKINSLTH